MTRAMAKSELPDRVVSPKAAHEAVVEGLAVGTLLRFETFSEDFAAWVMMYGPEGGEAAQ